MRTQGQDLRLSLPNTPSTAKSLRSLQDRATVPGRAEPPPLPALRRTRLLQNSPPTGHRDPGPAPSTRRPQTFGQTTPAHERRSLSLGAALASVDQLERCVDPRQAGRWRRGEVVELPLAADGRFAPLVDAGRRLIPSRMGFGKDSPRRDAAASTTAAERVDATSMLIARHG